MSRRVRRKNTMRRKSVRRRKYKGAGFFKNMRSKMSSGVRRAYNTDKRTFNRAKNYFNREKRAIQDIPPVEPLAEELEGIEDSITSGQLKTMGKDRDAGLQQALKNGLLEGPVDEKSEWVG